MDNIIKIREDDCLTPGLRVFCLLCLPTIALVQFFFPYSENFTTYLVSAISIAVILVFFAVIGFMLHYEFQYDSSTNCQRRSVALFSFRFGKWIPFDLGNEYKFITFQKLSQSYTSNFLNISSNTITEDVFVIRLMGDNNKIKTLVETTDYSSIPSCLLFGHFIAGKYNIPFNDYVKDMVKKSMKRKF